MYGTLTPSTPAIEPAARAGCRLRIRGQVQGVGFRPAVWHVANKLGLSGDVRNDGEGVLVRLYGTRSALQDFVPALQAASPPLARIDRIETSALPFAAREGFEIIASGGGPAITPVTPDAATCPHCLAEIRDPANRRYRYPFTNCTHCGPRLSIVHAIPYDRRHTSMAGFELCEHCAREYGSPADRRFHAQPNACPACGPAAWLQDQHGRHRGDAIGEAARRLNRGQIIALKGIGGFHLLCDARHAEAVQRLRTRKQRPAKPFALMARDIEQLRDYALADAAETELLLSPAAPVVLLPARSDRSLPESIAPGQNKLGFMLPYSPLHHLLLDAVAGPLVATSGNIGGLPPCTDNEQALQQLARVADAFVLHDRNIVNRVDDSVARRVAGQTRLVRRARGYAPAPIALPAGFAAAPQLLALGSELKNTFCLLQEGQAILSQHMGDLENLQTYDDYLHNLTLYRQLYQHRPAALAIDLHPDYLSSKLGRQMAWEQNLPVLEIQHHHAHLASCLAENHWPLDAGPVMGIVLDGIGMGDDGTLWGGEILLAGYRGYRRLAHLTPLPLPGGMQAMRQPWRNLLVQLRHAFGDDWKAAATPLSRLLNDHPVAAIESMLERDLNSPLASSSGRLFDAVAAALAICHDHISYEGQAAIELEALTDIAHCREQQAQAYRLAVHHVEQDRRIIDPASLWPALLTDIDAGADPGTISARFHAGLAGSFAEAAIVLARCCEVQHVALSGGVLQNSLLSTLLQETLQQAGLKVFTHQTVPANDGGLALGQAAIAAAQIMSPEHSLCV